jgi:hypothetical protein
MRFLLRVLPVLVLTSLSAGLAFPRPRAEPRQYALLVGVNAYDNAKFPALRFAINDATKLAALLEKYGYAVQLLTDQTERKPTRANIEAALGELFGRYNRELKRTEPGKFAVGDTVLIGLAGHGVQYGDSAYFCPRDAIPGRDQTGSLVAVEDVYAALKNSPQGVKFLLVDACRNDATRGIRGGDPTAAIQPPTGVGVLLSCSAKEVAYEHESLDGGHGVFFYHVLKGLEGAARDADDPVVTWDGLRTYVKKRVPRKVAELYGGDPGHQQHPNEMGNLSGVPPVLVNLSMKTAGLGSRPRKVPRLGIRPAYSEDGNGVLVDSVVEGSPAAKVGIQAGDHIVELAGKPVKKLETYMEVMAAQKAGTTIEIVVLRKDKRQTLKVALE